jgi:hypothetical protein
MTNAKRAAIDKAIYDSGGYEVATVIWNAALLAAADIAEDMFNRSGKEPGCACGQCIAVALRDKAREPA